MKTLKNVPQFKNEDTEREFWATHSPLDFPDQFKLVQLDLSNLKRSTRSVTLRLTESLFSQLKTMANKKDVPYQSLMKVYLSEKIHEEMQGPSSSTVS